ncbi:ribosome maturation factor RimP [Candidatus Poribacteria bacterium]|nr:ribosome maturation factor RimP [Candidatus Poribacteria bacterium]
MPEGVENTVTEMLTPLLNIEGYELVAVETSGTKRNQTLRLLIHKPGGLSLSDCQNVNKAVLPILEVHQIMSKYKHLEIASPGIDRPLTTEADFLRNKGRTVKVETYTSNKKNKDVIGKVIDINDGILIIKQASGKTVQIEFSQNLKGHIELNWESIDS